MKACSRCGAAKPADAFYKDTSRNNGLSSRCKQCAIEASCAWQEANRQSKAAYDRARRAEDTERYRGQNKANYEGNKKAYLAAARAWRLANPEKANASSAKWRRAHPAERCALIAKYRAAQKQRTPPWLGKAELAEIEGTYHLAAVLKMISGVAHQVDHVVPLQGETVSGLHVPWNLQVIPARENRVKSNRWSEQ